jgi:hypothetical protein
MILADDGPPQRGSARYLILRDLRTRVWMKAWWDIDGRGVGPWHGTLGEVVGGGFEEVRGDTKPREIGVGGVLREEQILDGGNGRRERGFGGR